MRWLVTGGAGYIGSHVTRALLAASEDVVVIDDLSSGCLTHVPDQALFVQGDILDGDAILDAMSNVDGVIHLAGRKSVSESIEKPLAYYDTNVSGTLSVLRAMRYRNVRRIVFSSTASVYATSDVAVTEDSPLAPSSPYAASKMFAERCIQDFALAHGIAHVSLRYFNVVGALTRELADRSRDNLMPRLIRALQENVAPEIFGDDYPTRDGTCVRDYVHVVDIADAHVMVAQHIDTLKHDCYNVGTGNGVTVLEMVNAIIEASGKQLTPIISPRRVGDPASVIANVSRLQSELGFRTKCSLVDLLDLL